MVVRFISPFVSVFSGIISNPQICKSANEEEALEQRGLYGAGQTE